MRKIGETVAGTILVEMPIEEWSSFLKDTDSPAQMQENSLEWHIRRAMEEKRLSPRVGNALLRGILGQRVRGQYYPGFLEGKSLAEFLSCLQDESILSVPSIGKKAVKEIRRVFLDNR